MHFEKVNNFYQALVNSKHFNEDLKNKLRRIHDEKEYKIFIKDELIPLAKSMGYDLSVDDILSYEHQMLQQLSEEELESVTGGTRIMKKLTTTFISALALAGSAYAMQAMNSMQAMKPINPSQSTTAKPGDAKDTAIQQALKQTISKATTIDELKKIATETIQKNPSLTPDTKKILLDMVYNKIKDILEKDIKNMKNSTQSATIESSIQNSGLDKTMRNLLLVSLRERQKVLESKEKDDALLAKLLEEDPDKKEKLKRFERIVQDADNFMEFKNKTTVGLGHTDCCFCNVSIFDDKTRGTVAKDIRTVEGILNGTVIFPENEQRFYEKAMGSMVAMAIADAIGARHEFQPFVFVKPGDKYTLCDMGHGANVNFNLKPGQWTDDTSMALCIADSLLLKNGHFDSNHLMYLFLSWWLYGFNNAFRFDDFRKTYTSVGLGRNISDSFEQYLRDPEKYTKLLDPNASGNGSVMRNAPIPICFHDDVQIAMDMAAKQSRVTHQGIEAADCCRLLTFLEIGLLNADGKKSLQEELDGLCKRFIEECPDCCKNVKDLAKSRYEMDSRGLPNYDRNWDWKTKSHEFHNSRRNKNPGYFGSYAMDAMALALNALYNTNNLQDAILLAVNRKGDADSVGSIVGQLAGAYYGIRAIPKDWVNILGQWDQHEIALRGYMLARLFDGKSYLDKPLTDENKAKLVSSPAGHASPVVILSDYTTSAKPSSKSAVVVKTLSTGEEVVEFPDSGFFYRGKNTNIPALEMKDFKRLTVFPGGILFPTDIVKTRLNDDALMAALYAMARFCPDAIKKSITDGKIDGKMDGTAIVKLYKRKMDPMLGELKYYPVVYKVQKTIPEYYLNSADGMPTALWVRLMEKVFVLQRSRFSQRTQKRLMSDCYPRQSVDFSNSAYWGNYSSVTDGSPSAFICDILGPRVKNDSFTGNLEKGILPDPSFINYYIRQENCCITCVVELEYEFRGKRLQGPFECSFAGMQGNLVILQVPVLNKIVTVPYEYFQENCKVFRVVQFNPDSKK